MNKLMEFNSFRLKFFSLFIFLYICMNMQAQIKGFCATSPNIPNFLSTIGSDRVLRNYISSSYKIGIFFHIMRKSDGTGGQTQQEVNTAFNILVSDYQLYNINFVLLGTDEIKSDNFYNLTNFYADTNYNTDLNGDGKFDVFSPNSHANAIDIYLFANDRLYYGLAANIPGTALVIGGNAFNTNLPSSHVLSHEVGHCLGLFHTFHGTDRVHEPIGCAEFVDGSNGTTCGDFVQDTPADPSYIYLCGTQSACSWDCSSSYIDGHGDHYNPDTHLFMAYTFPNCMNHHTAGQVARIFSSIANSSLLQNVIIRTILGPSQICTQGTYTIDLQAGEIISWTHSANLNEVSGQGTAQYIVSKLSDGIGWVKATLNGIVLPQIDIWAGVPSQPTYISGFESNGEVFACNTEYGFSVEPANIQGVNQYSWTAKAGSGTILTGQGTSWIDFFTTNSNKAFSISVKVANACGWSSTLTRTGTIEAGGPLLIYPNPATEAVTLTVENSPESQASVLSLNSISEQSTVSKTTPYEIQIWSALSGLMKTYKGDQPTLQISLHEFPKGIYYVHLIIDNKKVSIKTLLVK